MLKLFFDKREGNSVKIKIEPDIKKAVNNKIVEFVGVSGVGKSTLYHLNKEKFMGQWKFGCPNLDFKESLFDEKISEIHWDLLKNKSVNVNNLSSDHLRKLQLTAYFNRVLLDNLMMIDENYQSGFFIEEGLCHNFSKELMCLSDDDLRVVLRNRFLVYIKTENPLTVVDQIKKRSSEGGHTVYHHIGLSDSELLNLVINSIKQFETFFNRIKNIQVPVCVLMLEDGLEANSIKIVQFENKILND